MATVLIALLFLFSLLLILFALQPFWAIIDCAISERSTTQKTIWIISMLLLWSVAGIVYGMTSAKSQKLRIFSFIVGIPCELILLLGVSLYVQDPSSFDKYKSSISNKKTISGHVDSETIKNESQADLNTPLLKEIKIGLLLSKKNYSEALEELNKELATDPNNSKFLSMRGKAYAELNDIENSKKDFAKAISIINEAISKEPNSAELLFERSGIYMKMKEYDFFLNW
jgi:tetratricopeptide (TPR) repeat protein